MAAAGPEADYSNLVAFLATAGVVAPLVKRLKLSPILGFLAAGVVIGPEGLGRFADRAPWLNYLTVAKPEEIAPAAELGVVFLLFSIGLELSWERLRLMRKQVFGLGALQTLGAGAMIAVAAAAMGLGLPAALAAASALAMSSTALVVPVMAERGRLHASSGRARGPGGRCSARDRRRRRTGRAAGRGTARSAPRSRGGTRSLRAAGPR